MTIMELVSISGTLIGAIVGILTIFRYLLNSKFEDIEEYEIKKKRKMAMTSKS